MPESLTGIANPSSRSGFRGGGFANEWTDQARPPSILAANFACLGEEIRKVETAGADRIHVDVMDGRFVPNLSMGAEVVESLRKVTSLPLEVHLMVFDPDRYLDFFFMPRTRR